MPPAEPHPWQFRARFRRNAFGWKSQPALARLGEAVSEIKKVARKDAALGAEGAVLLIEKISPAFAQVDSSSGAIGSAVNQAIETLAAIIAAAPVEESVREAWMERLYSAYVEDGITYIETLAEHWGPLCASKEIASRWADRFLAQTRYAFDPEAKEFRFDKASTVCLSALLGAGRHAELLDLLAFKRQVAWHDGVFGVLALAREGKTDEAIEYAYASAWGQTGEAARARVCEAILREAGRTDEAYDRFALRAHERTTYLAWYRAVVKAYPDREPRSILDDLIAASPGEEGKWFAAAKDAGFLDLAIEIVQRAPAAPTTLAKAADDYEEKEPTFAMEAGIAALRWILDGRAYDLTTHDVRRIYLTTIRAATNAEASDLARARIQTLIATKSTNSALVQRALEDLLEPLD